MSRDQWHEARPTHQLNFGSYVSTREQMIQGRGTNYSRLTLEDIHEKLFFPLAMKVAGLVNAAKRSPGSNVDQRLIVDADRYRNTLESVCQYWTDNAGHVLATDGVWYSGPLWNHHDRQNRWDPAIGTAQHWSFNPQHQVYINLNYPPQPIAPINVQALLNDFGSGARIGTGVPPTR